MMQSFIYLSTILAVAIADGYYYEAPPAIFRVAPTPAATSSVLQPQQQYQFHTQDAFGQYAYGYSEPRSSKQEVRSLDGVTRGSYSYLDAEGKLQTVAYTADAGGFRVAATNLPQQQRQQLSQVPQPVQETPEVAAARAQHLAAHQQAKLRYFEAAAAAAATAPTHRPAVAAERKIVEHIVELPRPVEDTPEVAAAKVEFFKRYEEVRQRNEQLQQRDKKQEPGLSYSPVKSLPTAVGLPLPSYRAAIATNSGFHYGYDLVVPPVNGAYLPVA